MPGSVVVAQGEQIGRPSFLHVEVAPRDLGWRVRVGGGVRVDRNGNLPVEAPRLRVAGNRSSPPRIHATGRSAAW